MGQSLVKNYIVFSTKYREPLIHEPVEKELHAYLGGICKKYECHPIKVGGYTDHIHTPSWRVSHRTFPLPGGCPHPTLAELILS